MKQCLENCRKHIYSLANFKKIKKLNLELKQFEFGNLAQYADYEIAVIENNNRPNGKIIG